MTLKHISNCKSRLLLKQCKSFQLLIFFLRNGLSATILLSEAITSLWSYAQFRNLCHYQEAITSLWSDAQFWNLCHYQEAITSLWNDAQFWNLCPKQRCLNFTLRVMHSFETCVKLRCHNNFTSKVEHSFWNRHQIKALWMHFLLVSVTPRITYPTFCYPFVRAGHTVVCVTCRRQKPAPVKQKHDPPRRAHAIFARGGWVWFDSVANSSFLGVRGCDVIACRQGKPLTLGVQGK